MNLMAEVSWQGQRAAVLEAVGRGSCQLVLGVVMDVERARETGWRHKHRERQRNGLA